jgi:alpha-beta hydrolase superfamily lysophospholipase
MSTSQQHLADPETKTKYTVPVRPRNHPDLPSDWTSEWETFRSSDPKVQLFSVTHHKEPWKAKRILVVLHGLGEHGGRYLHVPHYVQSAVDSVYCLDLCGHGRSEGLRGHVERFDVFAEDLALSVRRLDEQLKKRFGYSEIHLLGHSLGGHIGLRALFLFPDLPIHSATISAPFLGIRAKVPFAKKFAAVTLSKIWRTLQLNTELDVNALSHDNEVCEAYLADRLVHSKMTPRFFTELQNAMADTLKRDVGITHPLQFIVPLQDELVDTEKSLEFFKRLKHRDKRLKTYPVFKHEPMNEIGKEQAFEDIVSWIESHTPVAKAINE